MGQTLERPEQYQGATGGHSFQGPGNYRFLFRLKSSVASTIPLHRSKFDERFGTKIRNIFGTIPYDIKLNETPFIYTPQYFFRRCFIVEAVISIASHIDKINRRAEDEEEFNLVDIKRLKDEKEDVTARPNPVEEDEVKVIEYSKMKRFISENKLEAYKRMCSALKRNCREIIDVAATKSSNDNYDFVVITPDPGRTKQNTEKIFPVIKEYPVIYRDVVNEGKLVQDKIREGRDQGGEMMPMVRHALMKYSARLMDNHKNLNAVHFSPFKSVGFLSGHLKLKHEQCIVLFVNIKFSNSRVPIGEQEFPSEIDGVPVDVRESYIVPFTYIGDEIVSHVSKQCATLGPVVNFPDHSVGCLTSMHAVIAKYDLSYIDRRLTTNVFKPTQYDEILTNDNQRIGYVEEYHYREGKVGIESGFEVALIKFFRYSHPRDAVFKVTPEKGNLHFNKAQYFQEIPWDHFCTTVIKFGAASGMTKGIFDASFTNIARLKCTNEDVGIKICDQISVLGIDDHKFAVKGDSGAIVVLPFKGNQNDLRAVGIVTGQMMTGQYLVSPIAPILDSFPGFELKRYSMEID